MTARRDELFELVDAVLCADGAVDLTLLPEHRRGHGAMYGGRIDVGRLRTMLAGLSLPRFDGGRLVLAVDVSPHLPSGPERVASMRDPRHIRGTGYTLAFGKDVGGVKVQATNPHSRRCWVAPGPGITAEWNQKAPRTIIAMFKHFETHPIARAAARQGCSCFSRPRTRANHALERQS
ncbi:transposase [Streptomyces sp. NPDC097617]|uniref:transposase n=1 Tax=Streptomyces sp. NPDC097617 TaxID=3366091 RepID=UPI00381BA01E